MMEVDEFRRQLAGRNAMECARELGVSRSAVYQWMDGGAVSRTVLILADLLWGGGVSSEWPMSDNAQQSRQDAPQRAARRK